MSNYHLLKKEIRLTFTNNEKKTFKLFPILKRDFLQMKKVEIHILSSFTFLLTVFVLFSMHKVLFPLLYHLILFTFPLSSLPLFVSSHPHTQRLFLTSLPSSPSPRQPFQSRFLPSHTLFLSSSGSS